MFTWLRRLRARIRYRTFHQDVAQELDVHRAMLEDAQIAEGIPANDARRHASQTLGNVLLARESARAVWLAPWLESVWLDLRYAVRTSLKRPGFALATIGTLALGIGLNTAFFTAFNSHFLQPWPAVNSDRVALVSQRPSNTGESREFSQVEAAYLRAHTSSFSHLATFTGPWATRIGAAPTHDLPDVFVGVVSSNFFDVLGRRMALGRNFLPEDERPDAARVTVISHGTWHRRFGGNPDVIGRLLYVNDGTPFTIIGVAPAGLHAPAPHQHEAWILPSSFEAPWDRPVTLVGRLTNGVNHRTAAVELTALHQQVRESTGASETRGVEVTSTSPVSSTASSRLFGIALIQAALAIVLLLACLNVANLQLARALSRRTEITLRLSLGAGRSRIVRQLVTEAALLAGLAAAAAFVTVYIALRAVYLYVTPDLIRQPSTPDTTVLAFTGGVGLLCTLVFGLVPALRSTVSLRSPITLASPAERTRTRFRSLLLGSQIALSAVLIVAASLLTRALVHASSSHPDFDLDGVVIGRLTVPSDWTSDAAASFRIELKSALERSSLWPVGFVDYEPLERVQFVTQVRVPDRNDDARTVRVQALSTEGLQVLRLHLQVGRAHDDGPGSSEIIVNETLARRFWPSGDAVGQTLVDHDHAYTVVGVVRDAYFASFESARTVEPILYRSPAANALTMIARGSLSQARDELNAIVRGIDPRVAADVVSLSDNVSRALASEILATRIAWAIGGLGLTLAVVGIFGLFGYVVEARRREIGIRLALGAKPLQVLASVFVTVQWAMLGGLGAGLLLSIGAGVLMRRQLFGLSPLDPLAYGLALTILLAAALIAVFVPARRAIRVDPAVTLRTD